MTPGRNAVVPIASSWASLLPSDFFVSSRSGISSKKNSRAMAIPPNGRLM